MREAAGTLVAGLAPQERAALVLKEAFDFSLEEIAAMLSTNVGAVKSALAPIILTYRSHDDGEHVRGVSLVTAQGDRIARLKTYMHSPELIAEGCRSSA